MKMETKKNLKKMESKRKKASHQKQENNTIKMVTIEITITKKMK